MQNKSIWIWDFVESLYEYKNIVKENYSGLKGWGNVKQEAG